MRTALGSLASLGLVALLALPAVPLAGCDSGDDGPTTCTSTDLFDIEDVTPDSVTTGDAVVDGACVSVAYVGRLKATGEEFDSGTGLRFFVRQGGGVIPGFWLGVREQKVGETRVVTVPPEFGYGATTLPNIPACSTLEFEITVEDTNLAPSLCQR